MDEFEFEAQFQQMPTLFGGNFFNEDDFDEVPRAPEGLQWYRYVDLALGKTQQSDFNATGAVAMDHIGRPTDGREAVTMRSDDEAIQFVKKGM